MSYANKNKEKEYQKSIPIELKRHYEKTYYATEKGKKYKQAKNRRYRERLLSCKLENAKPKYHILCWLLRTYEADTR